MNPLALRLLILLTWTASSFLQAQSTIALWQGFTNDWTYNHRVNRLGSYVRQPSGFERAELVHTAATGLGKDSVYFEDYYALLQAPALQRFSGKATFVFKGKEGKKMILRKTLLLPPGWSTAARPSTVAVLNGFDLVSVADADKFRHFSVKIGQPVYDSSRQLYTFSLEAALQMDCSSPECSWLQQNIDYTLDVYYLVLSAPEGGMAATALPYQKSLEWDKKAALPATTLDRSISTQQGFTAGCFAFTGWSLTLDEEHHYLGYHQAITQTDRNEQNQTAVGQLDLHFANSRPGMRKSPASGGQSFFAYASRGSAQLSGELIYLQFDGNASFGKQSGSLFWKGKNLSPKGKAAERSVIIPVK